MFQMEPSDPKWVNSIYNIIGVNSLRLGGLQIIMSKSGSFISVMSGYCALNSSNLIKWFQETFVHAGYSWSKIL